MLVERLDRRGEARGGIELDDHALDAAPAREMDMIADPAAGFGAARRLLAGILAEQRDQLGGAVRRGAVGDEMDGLENGFHSLGAGRRA